MSYAVYATSYTRLSHALATYTEKNHATQDKNLIVYVVYV